MFASKTNRMGQAKNLPMKKKSQDASVNAQYHTADDFEEYDSEDDNTPGPGAYHDPNKSNFSNKNSVRPQKHQFFGSTVERFADYRKQNQGQNVLGPGDYDVNSNSKQPKQIKGTNVSKFVGFSSGDQRFTEAQEVKVAATTPGPG